MTLTWYPSVDAGRCRKDCFACINFCPQKVFAKHNGIADVTSPEKCVENCSSCKDICPEKAIRFVREGFIDVRGIKVGVPGLYEALGKKSFDEAFAVIQERAYIPKDVTEDFRKAAELAYKRFKNQKP